MPTTADIHHRPSLAIVLLVVLAWPMHAQAQDEASAVRAVEGRLVKAQPLALEAVRLVGGPLKKAQDADAAFLLTVDPDRTLSALRTAAGLDAKAPPLGGWDNAKRRWLTGHIAGHLLSAVSLMYAATGDERFKVRADSMVGQLADIQEKFGDGFLARSRIRRAHPHTRSLNRFPRVMCAHEEKRI